MYNLQIYFAQTHGTTLPLGVEEKCFIRKKSFDLSSYYISGDGDQTAFDGTRGYQ